MKMFWLLMRVRLQSGINLARETLHRNPLLAVGLSVLGVVIFFCMAAGFWVFFQFAGQHGVLSETVFQIFYFLFLFLLAGAVPFVAPTLLHSADYGLLFASPVPPRAVIAAKLLDATVTNSLQFLALGVPAIAACAAALELPLLGWLLVPVLILLFVLLPALLIALGLLLALAALGMRRLRSAVTVLNGVMAFTVCVTIVVESGNLPMKFRSMGETASLATSFAPRSAAAHAAPSAWFADTLLLAASGDLTGTLLSLSKLFLIVGGLYALSMGLGARLLSAASVAEENDSGGRVNNGDTVGSRQFWHGIFAPPIAALVSKDIKYLFRDSVLLSQLAMPVMLYCVPFVLAFQDTGFRGREEMFPFAAMMTGVILFMQTSILSLSSVGLEGRSFWAVAASPNSGRTLVLAKFLTSVLISGGVGLLLTLIAGVVFGASLLLVGVQAVFVVLSATALCGMGVGLSAIFPRFVYENPAHRVSVWALILGFFAYFGYVIFTLLLFGLAWLMMTQYFQEFRVQILAATISLYLLVSALVTVLPLQMGARRIEGYQWEH